MGNILFLKITSKSVSLLTIMLTTIFLSCGEDDDLYEKTDNSTQFELTQPEILNVTSKGILLQFDFKSCSQIAVDEYGLIWYDTEDSVLLNNCVKSVKGKPSDGKITTVYKVYLKRKSIKY